MSEPQRVLVIDDEPEVAELLGKVLTRVGYQVTTAGTGEDGLVLMREHPYHLLIVDKNLPHMHGGEVIIEARKLQPGVAVILITAFPEPFALPPERLDGYLAKPFKSLQAIEEAAAAAIESSAAAPRRWELRERLNQVVAELTTGPKKRA